MKNIFLTVIALVAINNVFAQSDWCGSDFAEQQYINELSPEEAIQYDDNLMNSIQLAHADGQEQTGDVIVIPVVIHVLHDNCVGNISYEQIIDGLRVINEDYRRINSDTGATRSIFKPYASDSEIEFRLAQVDKNGNCFDGIVRYNTTDTYGANDFAKSGRVWDISKFMNVWLVESIDLGDGNGTLGYAYYPNYGQAWLSSRYGLMVRSDQWGTIGTSSADGRTGTHELGHSFGLPHTFRTRVGGQTVDGCGGNCHNSGDGICDTPPQYEPYWNCNKNLNTCSNDALGGVSGNLNPYTSDGPDMIENYMSYQTCQNMFSQGQVNVMRGNLKGVNFLKSLVSQNNLIARGVDSNAVAVTCKPLPDFCQDYYTVCEFSDITFIDRTGRDKATSRSWSFPGGVPSSSTDSIVTVSYEVAGTYNVSLTSANSAGSVTETKSVEIVSSTADFSKWRYDEDFENGDAFDTTWTVINQGGGRQWERTDKASYSGSNSVYIFNYINSLESIHQLVSPSFNVAAINEPKLSFKVAFARKNSNSTDILRVDYSYDCGNRWSFLGLLTGPLLESVSDFRTNDFVPANSSEWKHVDMKLGNVLKDKENVYLRFEFESGGGNNIYIDDINIESLTGIEGLEQLETIRVYPNPVEDVLFIDLSGNEMEIKDLQVRDISGRILEVVSSNSLQLNENETYQMNVSNFSPGIYFVQITAEDNQTVTKKFVVR